MPAEPTKAKLERLASRKNLDEYRFDGSYGRELEIKGSRGEVSCAECRRLKIKCDKQIPCQSCQRRGCAPLCPNGSLTTGQGARFVLAATEHLHRRIASLSGRVRQLEDALSTLQAKHSTEPHPLLQEDLIHVDEGNGKVDRGAEEGSAQAAQSAEVLEAFGTLSISEHGISRFFGPTRGSESLLLANFDSHNASSPNISDALDSLHDSKSSSLISNLSLFSHSFPFTPMGRLDDVQKLIESHLPPFERTLALCETYFEQLSWVFHGVTRSQVVDDMLPAIYKRQTPSGEDYSGPHDLAMLFMILAIGSLVGLEPKNAMGVHFHQLARAAISLQPVLEKPSVATIQTLHLMSIYNSMSGNRETSMEMTWSLLSLASHLSKTIGLHRDSARWGLSPKIAQRRRLVFWDLFIGDVWTSLFTGRPPSFSLAYIDCGYPKYEVDDGFDSVFEVWKCRFAAECIAEVTARTLTAEAPTYATIMELDRKIRDFQLPEDIAESSDNLNASIQRHALEISRETVMLYIHRSFFAQAIIEHPDNPLKSAYAPSFIAAYRASLTILQSIRKQFNTWPNPSCQFWPMWSFAFSASVVFGTVVTRGPRSPLAQSAMAELEQACALFSKASVYSIRATKALAILTRLSEKARLALSAAQNHPPPISGDQGGIHWNIKQDPDDELSIFAGHTRFVSRKRAPNSSNTSPPHVVRLSPGPPMYPTLSNQQISPSEMQSVNMSDYRSHPVVPSNYQPPLGLADSPSSSSNISTSTSTNLQSSNQHMASSLYNQHSSYIPREQIHQGPSSNTIPENSYVWSTSSTQQSMHHSVDITPPYEQPVRPQNCAQSQPQQHHQQHHVHAAHVNSVDSRPPLPHEQYAPQYPPQPHYSSAPSGQYHIYTNSTPGYQPQAGASTILDLTDLGLASRDSRLDQRWSSFIADSGLVGDFQGR